jgi:SEC-C motif-containing protein
MKPKEPCPCGSGRAYGQCCGLYHAGNGVPAPTAEALMRSRYCAYVLELEDYLRATWHASTCPASLDLTAPPVPKWIGLDIRRVSASENLVESQVEFVARYKINGKAHKLHEVSDFVREDGRWYYLSGHFPEDVGA